MLYLLTEIGDRHEDHIPVMVGTLDQVNVFLREYVEGYHDIQIEKNIETMKRQTYDTVEIWDGEFQINTFGVFAFEVGDKFPRT